MDGDGHGLDVNAVLTARKPEVTTGPEPGNPGAWPTGRAEVKAS
jgi:hypothetical protein